MSAVLYLYECKVYVRFQGNVRLTTTNHMIEVNCQNINSINSLDKEIECGNRLIMIAFQC